MIESVKATHPNTPLTLYANGSGGLLERLGATGADVVGLDWTCDMADARQRLGSSQSVQVCMCEQCWCAYEGGEREEKKRIRGTKLGHAS
jgi:hypothetical protein